MFHPVFFQRLVSGEHFALLEWIWTYDRSLDQKTRRHSETGYAMSRSRRDDMWYRVFESVYAEFHSTVCSFAARLIGKRLRRRIDAEDIAQSVFRTFYRHNAAGECDFENTRALRSYLFKMTANKVHCQAQMHGAKKRDIGCEVELDGSGNASLVPVLDASPAESAALLDELRFLTRGFSQRDLMILQLCLEGHTTPDIAVFTRCSRWTVRRVLDSFGARWQQRAGQIGGDWE